MSVYYGGELFYGIKLESEDVIDTEKIPEDVAWEMSDHLDDVEEFCEALYSINEHIYWTMPDGLTGNSPIILGVPVASCREGESKDITLEELEYARERWNGTGVEQTIKNVFGLENREPEYYLVGNIS